MGYRSGQQAADASVRPGLRPDRALGRALRTVGCVLPSVGTGAAGVAAEKIVPGESRSTQTIALHFSILCEPQFRAADDSWCPLHLREQQHAHSAPLDARQREARSSFWRIPAEIRVRGAK